MQGIVAGMDKTTMQAVAQDWSEQPWPTTTFAASAEDAARGERVAGIEQLRRELRTALAGRLEQGEVALPAVFEHLRSQLPAGEIGADLRVRARPFAGCGRDREESDEQRCDRCRPRAPIPLPAARVPPFVHGPHPPSGRGTVAREV